MTNTNVPIRILSGFLLATKLYGDTSDSTTARAKENSQLSHGVPLCNFPDRFKIITLRYLAIKLYKHPPKHPRICISLIHF